MITSVDYFYKGFIDAIDNKPKAQSQGLKGANKAAYESGYKQGHRDRSNAKQ